MTLAAPPIAPSSAGFGLILSWDIDHTKFDSTVDRMLNAVNEGADNPDIRAGLRDGMNVYEGFIRRRFSAASMSPGNPWADIKPSTKYARLHWTRTKGVSKQDRLTLLAGVTLPILYDTGTLYSSFVPGEPGWYEYWWPDGVSFGSSIVYSAYHQHGTDRMVARQILVPPDQETLNSIGSSVAAGLNAAFISAASF